MNIKKQLHCFFAHEALLSFRITDVVWVLFLLERGYNFVQIGLAEGILHITSVICEVPSGMMADIIGRKRTLILSASAMAISSLFIGFGNHIIYIFLGMVIFAVGLSMTSGTEEALLYDSLVEVKETERFKKIRVRMSMISRISNTLSCLFSPVAIFLGCEKVYVLSAVLNAIQILFLIKMKESVVTELQATRKKNPLQQIREQWKQHYIETFSFVKGHPKTICKLLASAAIASPCYLTMMYLQEHLVNCGWPKSWIGVPMLLIPLGGVAGAWLAGKSRMSLLRCIILFAAIGGVGTIFAGTLAIPIAILGAVAGRIAEGFIEIIVSEKTNTEFSSDQRATLISIDGFLYSMLMIVLSPLTGGMVQRHGMTAMFGLMGSGLILAMLLGIGVYLVAQKYRKRRVSHFGK